MGFSDVYSRHKRWFIGGGVLLGILVIVLIALGASGVLSGGGEEEPTTSSAPVTDPTVTDSPRFRLDCLPDQKPSKEECEQRGCAYDATDYKNQYIPTCYRDSSKHGFYKLRKSLEDSRSTTYDLLPPTGDQVTQVYSPPFIKPQLIFEKKTDTVLRMKFSDARSNRYEVPVEMEDIDQELIDPAYTVEIDGETTNGIKIKRKSTGVAIWDMSLGGLFLEDQYLQITTKLPTTYVYGFGENRHYNFRHKMDWRTWPMFSRDEPPTNPNAVNNVYGVHPFYMVVEADGSAHGVLLFNSNAMEYQFQPEPALVLRSIGGVLDFYIFMGPTPENVVQQYTSLLGTMFMPPYWGLGFQISRWGFRNLDHVKEVVDRNVKERVPLDSVYGDIDYMRHRQDFTVDQDNYAGLPEYVDYLHQEGMRYVIILDPAIHADAATKHPQDAAYLPYTDGLDKDIYIKWPQEFIPQVQELNADSIGPDRVMLGKVWPDGRSAFPDFFKPSTLAWWKDMISRVYNDDRIKFDALWIDMNEVSSFDTNGNASQAWYCVRPWELPGNHTCFALQCPLKDNRWDNPPYKPMAVRNWGEKALLSDKTVCMIGETYYRGSVHRQYDLHSLYGWSQAEVTAEVSEEVRGKRSFVFSRSTYPGGQRFVGHWLGDNAANFEELRYSLVGLLEFSLFGYGYVGADICGFFDNSTSPLCSRWVAAGAFYPFARSHNGNNNMDQDPAVWPEVAQVARRALGIRYSLLPYLYTLFYKAHCFGDTVSRPVHHEYPTDPIALDTDNQFLWGSALLISPILADVNERDVRIPNDFYFDYYTGSLRTPNTTYKYTWDGDQNVVALDLRAGYILPHQVPATNTRDSRKNPFYLTIAVHNSNPVAVGELYWDDGEAIDPVYTGRHFRSTFNYYQCEQTLVYTVRKNAGPDMSQLRLSEIHIYSNPTVTNVSTLEFYLDQTLATGFSASIKENTSILIIRGPFPMDRNFQFRFAEKTSSAVQ